MKMQTLRIGEEKYPENLAEIHDPPERFFYFGDLVVLKNKRIAIVGTRLSTAHGEAKAFEIAKELSQAGITVISGLAYGIDAAAHRGALEGPGGTIAVLANGLPDIRPSRHRELARRIVKSGGLLISEQPKGEPVFKSSYLVRNRLISGLSDAVVVVEAAYRSGALNTANHALDQNRDVMAVPGRPGDKLSFGTNRLIQRGAQLVGSAKDVAEFVGFSLEQKALPELQGFHKRVFELLIEEPHSMSELGEVFHEKISDLYEVLGELEMLGLIKLVSKRYAAVGGSGVASSVVVS